MPPSPSSLRSDLMATVADLLGPGFRTLARVVQTGVVLLDPDGEPAYVNQAACELLGLGRLDDEPPCLERLKGILPSDLRPAPGGGPAEHEIEIERGKKRPRTRRVVLRALPIEDEGCGVLVLVEDRSRAAALEASLRLASRMRTWSLFRGQIHDLKAPLNALALNLDLLRRSLEDEESKEDEIREEQLDITTLLEREVARLGRALDAFLERTAEQRGTEGPTRRFEARRLVREVAKLLRPRAKNHGVRLHVSVPEPSVHLVANRDRIKQALLNLVLNAFEAVEEGGEIQLRVEEDPGRVRIVVQDDGEGIPPELRDKVFEMHFTTKEHGTGIGLTVARSLIEAQGGRLHLESGPDGTTVTLEFERTHD